VKQLLDDDAVNVAFGHGIDSTVKRMGQLKRPAETGDRQKKERRVYRLWAIFDSIPPSETSPGVKLGYKTEDNDNDIHLAIRDSTGGTMVVEFPTTPAPPAPSTAGTWDEARKTRQSVLEQDAAARSAKVIRRAAWISETSLITSEAEHRTSRSSIPSSESRMWNAAGRD
jgi:hypothetical protein